MAFPADLELTDAFRELLESSAGAIIALDRDGCVIAWSPGAERILGWSRKEALGRRLPGLPPDREEEFERFLGRVMGGETVHGLSVPHRRKDGSTVSLLLSITPLHRSGGEVRGMLAIATDVSEADRVGELRRRISELEIRLSEMRLGRIRDRLPPHFLLNGLHAASVLLRKGQIPDAVHVLASLGALLRQALDTEGRPEIPLDEELAFLDRYLEVERRRFGGDLRVEVKVAPEARDALVPAMALQPLVENAVTHGVVARRGGGTVEVIAERTGGELLLQVRDDGRGLPEGFDLETDAGVGLSAVRAKLEELYGEGERLAVEEREGGGVRAILRLPLRLPGKSRGGSPPRDPAEERREEACA